MIYWLKKKYLILTLSDLSFSSKAVVIALMFALSSSSWATGKPGDLLQSAIEVIKREEGFRTKAYKDTDCCVAIGYGRLLKKDFGFNLSLYPETTALKENVHLELRVTNIDMFLGVRYGRTYVTLDVARKSVLISMTYQMGYTGVTNFKNMWKALEGRDFVVASRAMKNSRWFNQTKSRAIRHADVMATGVASRR